MWELKKDLETRKENLIFLLKNKKDFLEIEKQHQLYGAIKEIDHIISLIEHQRDKEQIEKIETQSSETISAPDLKVLNKTAIIVNTEEGEQEIVAKKVSEKTKKFRIPISFKFSNK